MDTLEKLFRLASIETSRVFLENSSVWNIAFAKKNNCVCVCVCKIQACETLHLLKIITLYVCVCVKYMRLLKCLGIKRHHLQAELLRATELQ